eukprot:TRINITY_DN29840_c0_g1_i1.p1 TRINITY_DN29840_c0_g1~~TRINITY_DN29840_c0_g1_i1.p1  ORF type:complete len:217 (-),score=53.40 TRINITY_DN29840_c0_g1_i1:429-1079(-)
MVKGSADPIIMHDTSHVFTRRRRPLSSLDASTRSQPRSHSSSEWHNFSSPKIKDMYEKPSKASTNLLDTEDKKTDIKKLLKEIEYLGSSHMSWKERKQMENRNVVNLGGKPPKSHLLPLSVAKFRMKKQKEREEKMLQEGLILGKYGTHGNTKKRLEKRKADDQILKASEGHFKNGILNVKHLLGGASSSRKEDNAHKVSKGKKKGKGRKGKKKHQ